MTFQKVMTRVNKSISIAPSKQSQHGDSFVAACNFNSRVSGTLFSLSLSPFSLSHSHRKTCNEVIKIFKLTPYVFGIPYPGVGYISQPKENIKNIFETDLALLSAT